MLEKAVIPRILFVRHGETDWNVEGRLQGQKDIPLNALGRIQADDVGRRLSKLINNPVQSQWIVSPLGRTRETAEIARRALGLEPLAYRTEDQLKEITFGAWEGFTWAELRKSAPSAEAERAKNKWGYVPPGGESYEMLTKRIGLWLDTVTDEIVAVSHGGVARALMVLAAGLSPDDAPRHEIHQGRVLEFADGRFRWH